MKKTSGPCRHSYRHKATYIVGPGDRRRVFYCVKCQREVIQGDKAEREERQA